MRKITEIEGNRINNLKKLEKAIGRASLANRINRSYNLISQYLAGQKNVGEGLARDIEESLGQPTYWLDQNHNVTTQDLIPLGKSLKSNIPSVQSLLKSGYPNNGEELKMFDELLIDEMDDMKLENKNAYWFKVKDDSMKPYIQPGTLTMIDKGKSKIEPGSCYALNVEGEVVLRRVYRDNGQYRICCDNTALKINIPDINVEDFNGNIKIMGKMVCAIMKF